MSESYESKAVMLLTILQEPNLAKAREKFCEIYEIDEIDDRDLYDLIEERVFDATLINAPTVELDIEQAQAMLLLLRKGMRRPKGGQPASRHERLRKRAAVALGRKIKAELVLDGRSKTQAHGEAAVQVAEALNKYSHVYSANYLAREMQKTDH